MITIKEFENYVSRKNQILPFNEQTLYKFPNNYGASVILGHFTYGLELAVISFTGDDWDLDYSTPITNNVIGHLEEDSLKRVLEAIYYLPPKRER
ncbi:hypothetical protein JR552_001799 [Listeria monocytogenes serotype 1/2b]|uniref:hypothetical protein n=1 Tax=Listeria seeligeri TaxID=1640 RepID=UPI00162AF167|nr:hypothetical protein [Listeria seeligeri]EHC6275940.1 hypothetical protein [Listeria monocytogenes serotype 1/2b]MBC2071801.1 hypothetical protein [Listeria seeligeri]